MATLTLRTVVARPLTNQEVDDNFSSLNAESGNTLSNVGILSNLSTSQKSNIVSSINEVWGINANVGVIKNLTTTSNSNLVSAINVLDQEVGNVQSLITPVTSNLVATINDIYSKTIGDVNITNGNISGLYRLESSNVKITGGNITGITNFSATSATITGGTFTNITAIAATGNVSASNVIANYFIGNGSLLTGISADTTTRFINGNSNINIRVDGNITATVQDQRILVLDRAGGTGNSTFTGNVTANYYFGNGALLNGIAGAEGLVNGNTSVRAITNGNITFNTSSIVTMIMERSGSVANSTFFGNVVLNSGNLTLNNGGLTLDSGALSVNGNVSILGTGRRIISDFHNGTAASRTLFQASGTNQTTSVGALPSGTGTESNFIVYNNNNLTNAAFGVLSARSDYIGLRSLVNGAGSYLPIVFTTSDVERVKIETNGNVMFSGNIVSSQNVITGNVNVTNSITTDRLSATGAITGASLNTSSGSISGGAISGTTLSTSGLATLNSLTVTGSTTFAGTTALSAPGTASLGTYTQNVATATASGGTVTLSLANSDVFVVTMTASSTLAFSNAPASGRFKNILLVIRQDATGSRIVTWPASARWTDSVSPTLTTTGSRADVVSFFTHDGGTTYYGTHVMANVSY